MTIEGIAARAGVSPKTIHRRIYAECVVDQDETAKRRIAEVLQEDSP